MAQKKMSKHIKSLVFLHQSLQLFGVGRGRTWDQRDLGMRRIYYALLLNILRIKQSWRKKS